MRRSKTMALAVGKIKKEPGFASQEEAVDFIKVWLLINLGKSTSASSSLLCSHSSINCISAALTAPEKGVQTCFRVICAVPTLLLEIFGCLEFVV